MYIIGMSWLSPKIRLLAGILLSFILLLVVSIFYPIQARLLDLITQASIQINPANQQTPPPQLDPHARYIWDNNYQVFQKIDEHSKRLGITRDQGIFIETIVSDTKEELVALDSHQSLVSSFSPRENLLVYNTATYSEDAYTEENIKIIKLPENQLLATIELPKETTFAGVSYWSKVHNGFYYKLRGTNTNLHFPDPETTKFFWYDLDNNTSQFIASADQLGVSHTDIIGETPNADSFYVESIGHGEYQLMQLAKFDKHTLKKQIYFDSQSINSLFSISERAFDKNEVTLSEMSFSQDQQQQQQIVINLAENTIQRKISHKPNAEFSPKKSFTLSNKNISTNETQDKILITSLNSQQNIQEIIPENPENLPVTLHGPTIEGFILFTLGEIDGRPGLVNPENGHITMIEKVYGELIPSYLPSNLISVPKPTFSYQQHLQPTDPTELKKWEDIFTDIYNDGYYLNKDYWFRFTFPESVFDRNYGGTKRGVEETIVWYNSDNDKQKLQLKFGLLSHDAGWFWFSPGDVDEVGPDGVAERVYYKNYAEFIRSVQIPEYQASLYRLHSLPQNHTFYPQGILVEDGYALTLVKDDLYISIATDGFDLKQQEEVINQIANDFSPLRLEELYEFINSNQNILY